MDDDGAQPRNDTSSGGNPARDEFLSSLIYNTVGLAFQLGLVVIVVKRDWVRRQVLRYKWYVMQEWKGAQERRATAEVRAEISRLEHELVNPPAPRRRRGGCGCPDSPAVPGA